MSTRIRTLSGLLDFECAARWSSFRLAAAELNKTPAAVSQQVKQLERTLGFDLFVRHPRNVTLTESGIELAGTLARLFQELHRKVDAIREVGGQSVIRISTTHSFAMKWLIPRIQSFTRDHPEYDVRIEANDKVVRVGEDCHVALRFTPEETGASAGKLLFDDVLVAAYSPALVPASPGAAIPVGALLRQPLLYEGTPEAWLKLFEANGIGRRRFDFARNYSHAGLMVQAAVAGHGVALVPFSLACDDIAQERLVVAPLKPLRSGDSYRLLRDDVQKLPRIDQFEAWAMGEVAKMKQQLGQLIDSLAVGNSTTRPDALQRPSK